MLSLNGLAFDQLSLDELSLHQCLWMNRHLMNCLLTKSHKFNYHWIFCFKICVLLKMSRWTICHSTHCLWTKCHLVVCLLPNCHEEFFSLGLLLMKWHLTKSHLVVCLLKKCHSKCCPLTVLHLENCHQSNCRQMTCLTTNGLYKLSDKKLLKSMSFD
jgi:hypothetical protein